MCDCLVLVQGRGGGECGPLHRHTNIRRQGGGDIQLSPLAPGPCLPAGHAAGDYPVST